MTNDLEKIQDARNKALAAFETLKRKIADEKYQARIAAEASVVEKYADERSVLSNAYYDLNSTLTKLKDDAASHPWEGEQVVGMVQPNWRRSPERVVGLVEVVRTKTVFPENMASYRKPSVGAVIIRKLKKDGTPSKQFHDRFYEGQPLGKWKLKQDSHN